MRSFILFSLLWAAVFSVTTSCSDKPSEEVRKYQELYREVIAVHDEVMPKMGELNALSRTLKQEQDSISATHTGILDSLKLSHTTMMEWMKDFSEKFPYGKSDPLQKTPEELHRDIELLQAELGEVNRMKDLIEESMTKAKKAISGK
ncbi:hypothetical protein [Sinomicrobium soli]|uniref:hypothetical protein n=1 Tax=Sinomicrobium sp. N-1-3-6 TaxID=2219864 RepID=UPI000DCF0DFD|nr:hypothetical protein [Sinomicrobium sp. N-1-3-6]RAV30575.1 hypothetical protein DN748_03515 [Sinomicrobium sp. N-1-3-6]